MSRFSEMTTTKSQIEVSLIGKLGNLEYVYRPEIRALEANSRKNFEGLNPATSGVSV